MRLLRLLAPFLLFLPTPAAAADLVLEAGAHFVEAQVNGQPVRLRVDPEASGYIILNPAAVQRAALRPSLTRAVTYIGPVRLTGRTKSTTVTIGARTDERRIIWMDRDAAADADGIISPADLPYDRVTLNLRPPAAGEQAFTLPMTYQRSAGLVHSLRIGEQEIGFKISTANSHTLATAAAGALIAAQQGGAWAGEARAQLVRFSVERPARPFALDRPLMVGGRSMDAMLVRVSDHRGDAALPPEPLADPDEVVVTAATGRQRARHSVVLGADWLAGCSSVTWDNRTRQLTFSCAAP
jgi:hypothetical protein